MADVRVECSGPTWGELGTGASRRARMTAAKRRRGRLLVLSCGDVPVKRAEFTLEMAP